MHVKLQCNFSVQRIHANKCLRRYANIRTETQVKQAFFLKDKKESINNRTATQHQGEIWGYLRVLILNLS